MAASSKLMIVEAERRFPCRIKLGVPIGGLASALPRCTHGSTRTGVRMVGVMTPARLRGVISDAVATYFNDAMLAAAFVARWCGGSNVEVSEGAFRVREDQSAPRDEPGLHKTCYRSPRRLRIRQEPISGYAEKLLPGSSVPSGDKALYCGEKMRTIIAAPLVSAVCFWAGITQAPAQSQSNPLHAAGASLSITENSQTHTTDTESGNEHPGEPRAQSGSSLSRELNQSGGVIHPPPSADRNIVTPPNRVTHERSVRPSRPAAPQPSRSDWRETGHSGRVARGTQRPAGARIPWHAQPYVPATQPPFIEAAIPEPANRPLHLLQGDSLHSAPPGCLNAVHGSIPLRASGSLLSAGANLARPDVCIP